MRFHPHELSRDVAWKAARERVRTQRIANGFDGNRIEDYWVLDELHEEAIEDEDFYTNHPPPRKKK